MKWDFHFGSSINVELTCGLIVYLRGAGGFSKSSPPYSCSKYPTGQIKPVQFAKIWYTSPHLFDELV
ncbi:hypothetical protein MKW98_004217 [Papaver atlanticum]|uniref:Uncharacterized protein n=1 Tax=Papaver atlanticum TaxID=357466 RepID=A0AAD4T662_9MAGN|nr:hypothetical protein MKW98_004217 [Papaver atlanticum]